MDNLPFGQVLSVEIRKGTSSLRETEPSLSSADQQSVAMVGQLTEIFAANVEAALLKAQEETMTPTLPSFSDVVRAETALTPKPWQAWPAPDRASSLFSRPWRLRGTRSVVLVPPDVLSNAARRIVTGMMSKQPYTMDEVRAVCLSEAVPASHSRICADRLLQTMRRAGLIEYINQSWRVKS